MSEWNYVVAAYAVAWTGLLGYAVRLALANRRARAAVRSAGGEA
ncbi:MAG TPA: CcmD family protein [Longimicrobiales bacterium]|nr:CcmD family protein [Longimicrobiales bacterium]